MTPKREIPEGVRLAIANARLALTTVKAEEPKPAHGEEFTDALTYDELYDIGEG